MFFLQALVFLPSTVTWKNVHYIYLLYIEIHNSLGSCDCLTSLFILAKLAVLVDGLLEE
jgi:hypothetical protein